MKTQITPSHQAICAVMIMLGLVSVEISAVVAQDLSFAPTTYTVGRSPNWVLATNLTAGTNVDLVSANIDDDTLTVLTNDGTGNFAVSATLAVGWGPSCVVAADLRGTGHPDLISVNYDNDTLTVLTNDGSGNFTISATLEVGAGPWCAVATDLRGTGHPDLVCANYDDNTLLVLTNDGSGNLASNTTISVGSGPTSLVAADLRGTGRPDVVCANYADDTLTVLTNNGAGHLGFNATVPVGGGPLCVTAADLRGTGKPDLVTADYDDNKLRVLTNNGSGQFATKTTLGLYTAGYVIATDLRRIGRQDLIGAAYNSSALLIYTNDGHGDFACSWNWSVINVGSEPACIAAADVSGKDNLALISANSGYKTLTVERQDQPPRIDDQPCSQFPFPGSYAMFSASLTGIQPLAYQWLFNGTNLSDNSRISGSRSDQLFIADVQACDAGSYQLVVTNLYGKAASQAVPLAMAHPPGIYLRSTNCLVNDGYSRPCWVVATNMTGGPKVDLVMALLDNSALFVMTNDGGGDYEFDHCLFGSAPSCRVAAADLNGMGKLDLVCANYNDYSLTVFTNDGCGNLASNATLYAGLQPCDVAAADFRGTGRLDLVCANHGDDTLTVFTNDSHGHFGFNAIVLVGGEPSSVAAADLRGTGRPDLVSANYADNTLTILTNNGSGHFGYDGTLPVGAEPTCVMAADIGGWGKTALITADSGDGMLTVLRQDVPPMITAQPQSQAAPAGGAACFRVGVVGAMPIGFQWLVNGTNLTISPPFSLLSGGELTITNVQGGNVGTYQVVMTNLYGSATSRLVALQLPPTISPTAQAVFIGNQATWLANCLGVGPMSYQWQCNGTNVAGNIITAVAGNGDCNYYGDGGPATNAALCYPQGLAVDSQGNLFIADTESWAVRKVDTNGIITTVAGNGGWDYDGDGVQATNASVHSPKGVAVDNQGNLFIADTYHNRIRKVDANGIITTVAGNGDGGFHGDGGPATNATLSEPVSVAVAGDGTLFIADRGNYRIRQVDTNGMITTVAGSGERQEWFNFVGSGIATNIPLGYLKQLSVDSTGELLIVDDYVLRRLFSNGYTEVLAGGVDSGSSGDGGLATSAELFVPGGVVADNSGRIYITDTYGIRLTYVLPDCNIYSLDLGGGGGWNYLGNVALDPTGQRLFVTDIWNNRIWAVSLGNSPTRVENITTPGQAGNYSAVAIGPYGSVTSSVAVFAVSGIIRYNDGSVTVGFAGEPSSPARLWMTTNLVPPVVWEPIATNDCLGPDGVWTFTDTNRPSAPQRCYLLSTP